VTEVKMLLKEKEDKILFLKQQLYTMLGLHKDDPKIEEFIT